MRELKFEIGFTNHAPIIVDWNDLISGAWLDNMIQMGAAGIKYKRQYIGQKDKTGKEIYHGDIKRWKFNHHDRIYLCYWSEPDCGFRWKLVKHNEKQDLTDESIHFDTEKDYYDYVIKSNQRQNGFDKWSELIGDIHTTPELLKD